MATEQQFKILSIPNGDLSTALNQINQNADTRYFPVSIFNSINGVPTVLLSQGVNTLNGRHPDVVNVHFSTEDNDASENFVVIDLDDLVNYPHFNDTALDIDNIQVSIDTSTNADYEIEIGFLQNVNGTDGEFVEVFRTSGKNSKGATVNSGRLFSGGAGLMRSDKWLSSNVELSTDFANTVNLASTIDVNTLNTNPDNGDLVMKIARGNVDALDVALTISYKSI